MKGGKKCSRLPTLFNVLHAETVKQRCDTTASPPLHSPFLFPPTKIRSTRFPVSFPHQACTHHHPRGLYEAAPPAFFSHSSPSHLVRSFFCCCSNACIFNAQPAHSHSPSEESMTAETLANRPSLGLRHSLRVAVPASLCVRERLCAFPIVSSMSAQLCLRVHPWASAYISK